MRKGVSAYFGCCLAKWFCPGATQVLAQAYLALERPGTVTAIQGLGVGIGLLLMPGLITEFGGPGAPLALLISSMIRFAITFCHSVIF